MRNATRQHTAILVYLSLYTSTEMITFFSWRRWIIPAKTRSVDYNIEKSTCMIVAIVIHIVSYVYWNGLFLHLPWKNGDTKRYKYAFILFPYAFVKGVWDLIEIVESLGARSWQTSLLVRLFKWDIVHVTGYRHRINSMTTVRQGCLWNSVRSW